MSKKYTLALSEKSFLHIEKNGLPVTKDELKELIDVCPRVHKTIKLMGRECNIPRFEELYGTENYTYSGVLRIANPNIPPVVQRCLEYVRTQHPEFEWQGALVNWYMNGNNYIGPHSDSEGDLNPGAPIVSFSFGAPRKLRFKAKKGKKVFIEEKDIMTENGLVITMAGAIQKEFKHEIVPVRGKLGESIGPRVNVTVRSFKNNNKRQRTS